MNTLIIIGLIILLCGFFYDMSQKLPTPPVFNKRPPVPPTPPKGKQ